MKLWQTTLTVFAVIGGVYGALVALDARFVPMAFADDMRKQIQAITKRLDVKISEDQIFNAEREVWEKIKRYGNDSVEVKKAKARVGRLKRKRPK